MCLAGLKNNNIDVVPFFSLPHSRCVTVSPDTRQSRCEKFSELTFTLPRFLSHAREQHIYQLTLKTINHARWARTIIVYLELYIYIYIHAQKSLARARALFNIDVRISRAARNCRCSRDKLNFIRVFIMLAYSRVLTRPFVRIIITVDFDTLYFCERHNT